MLDSAYLCLSLLIKHLVSLNKFLSDVGFMRNENNQMASETNIPLKVAAYEANNLDHLTVTLLRTINSYLFLISNEEYHALPFQTLIDFLEEVVRSYYPKFFRQAIFRDGLYPEYLTIADSYLDNFLEYGHQEFNRFNVETRSIAAMILFLLIEIKNGRCHFNSPTEVFGIDQFWVEFAEEILTVVFHYMLGLSFNHITILLDLVDQIAAHIKKQPNYQTPTIRDKGQVWKMTGLTIDQIEWPLIDIRPHLTKATATGVIHLAEHQAGLFVPHIMGISTESLIIYLARKSVELDQPVPRINFTPAGWKKFEEFAGFSHGKMIHWQHKQNSPATAAQIVDQAELTVHQLRRKFQTTYEEATTLNELIAALSKRLKMIKDVYQRPSRLDSSEFNQAFLIQHNALKRLIEEKEFNTSISELVTLAEILARVRPTDFYVAIEPSVNFMARQVHLLGEDYQRPTQHQLDEFKNIFGISPRTLGRRIRTSWDEDQRTTVGQLLDQAEELAGIHKTSQNIGDSTTE